MCSQYYAWFHRHNIVADESKIFQGNQSTLDHSNPTPRKPFPDKIHQRVALNNFKLKYNVYAKVY
jgi:hypothetical protein